MIKKKHFIIFSVTLLFFLSGVSLSILNQYVPFDYLYRSYIKREFAINPQVEIREDKQYQITYWYYPIFKALPGGEELENEIKGLIDEKIRNSYPNFSIKFEELSFIDGRDKLREALQEGRGPDLYMNLSNDFLLDSEYQIPLNGFLTASERELFAKINPSYSGNNYWVWPFSIYKQQWVLNSKLDNDGSKELYELLERKPDIKLALNFYDPLLLRQLLTLKGLEIFELEKDLSTAASMKVLDDVFSLIHDWRQRDLFIEDGIEIEYRFLKLFFEYQGKLIIGPLNFRLAERLKEISEDNQLTFFDLDNQIQLNNIVLFRQKKYQGDDHSKAVIETAREISRILASFSENYSELKGVFNEADQLSKEGLLMGIEPEAYNYWKNDLQEIWLDFWKRGISPQQVVNLLY